MTTDKFTDFLGAYLNRPYTLVVADIFSVITILSCTFIKIPQINTIRSNKFSGGISILALAMELSSYTIMMMYNYCNGYSIISYMEYPMLLIQEYILIYVVLKYQNVLNAKAGAATTIYALLTIGFLTKVIPSSILKALVPFCTPVGATSKVMQLIAIVRSKDSRSISLTTWLLSAFTNSTRIYTVMVESGDMMLLMNFTISFGLSFLVFLAAFYYRKPKEA